MASLNPFSPRQRFMAAIIPPAQVQVDGAAPLFGREIRHTLEDADTGVVDQKIQAAETRIHDPEEAPHIFQLRYVGGFRHQPTADPENVNAISTALQAVSSR